MNAQYLNQFLTKEQREFGLSIDEMDDHFLAIKYKDSVVRNFTGNPLIFNASKVSIETIQNEATQWLNWMRSGISFVKEEK